MSKNFDFNFKRIIYIKYLIDYVNEIGYKYLKKVLLIR